MRADLGLQRAFGRRGCAEQSVVQDTLDACTAENVNQMHQAMEGIFRRHSQTYRHDYQLDWQILDVDMTGRPCGKKAKFASKGYFAKQRNRRGRQVGYVIGTWYEEIVVEQLFDGQHPVEYGLAALIEATEQVLELDERKHQRTIVRIDLRRWQCRGTQLAAERLAGAWQGLFRGARQNPGRECPAMDRRSG